MDLSAVSGDSVARPEYEIELLNALDPTHYDFDFAIAPGRTLDFHFMFNGNVYPRSQIERTASHLLTVIAQVLEHPATYRAIRSPRRRSVWRIHKRHGDRLVAGVVERQWQNARRWR